MFKTNLQFIGILSEYNGYKGGVITINFKGN